MLFCVREYRTFLSRYKIWPGFLNFSSSLSLWLKRMQTKPLGIIPVLLKWKEIKTHWIHWINIGTITYNLSVIINLSSLVGNHLLQIFRLSPCSECGENQLLYAPTKRRDDESTQSGTELINSYSCRCKYNKWSYVLSFLHPQNNALTMRLELKI